MDLSLFLFLFSLLLCLQAFFAQIYSEAQGSNAAPGHHALAQCDKLHRMRRHYTLNIDGLSEVVSAVIVFLVRATTFVIRVCQSCAFEQLPCCHSYMD